MSTIEIGMDSDSYFCVLITNTKLGFPETEQYELKCSIYKYFYSQIFNNHKDM
jgi:hypothetical protein